MSFKTIEPPNIYVASGGPPGGLGGPHLRFCGLFRQFHVNALRTQRVRSMSLVLGCYIIYGVVTSSVMSQHRMCSGHVTFFYKRLAGASFWALFALTSSWFVHQVRRCHPRMAGVQRV